MTKMSFVSLFFPMHTVYDHKWILGKNIKRFNYELALIVEYTSHGYNVTYVIYLKISYLCHL